jgi:hypothetical protein
MPPTTTQASVESLMQTAVFHCPNVGDALTAPALVTVVVPEVTAEIVTAPAPLLRIVMAVPTGNATEAFVGILKATAVALFIGTRTWY